MACELCSGKGGPDHEISEIHKKNLILKEFHAIKSQVGGNRRGIKVACKVQSSYDYLHDNISKKIKLSTQPNESVTFRFTVFNETNKEEVDVHSVQILHTKYDFKINDHGLDGDNPHKLQPKEKLQQEIYVTFRAADVGQYETPIVFKFVKPATNIKISIVRDMVVYVEKNQVQRPKIVSPYGDKKVEASTLVRSPGVKNDDGLFRIPENNKSIYLADMKMSDTCDDKIRTLATDIRYTFNVGITKKNYKKFFHHLLWFEETLIRKSLQKYNMSGVCLGKRGPNYTLYVPGLAEKRPSLMVGDILFIRPHKTNEVMFEAVVSDIDKENAIIEKLHNSFHRHYNGEAKFDIRFFLSRVPLERMHMAVHDLNSRALDPRIFPKESKTEYIQPKLDRFFNPLVEKNPEQRMAVEHIVSRSSGSAPYLVHGPPGTGKTVTIVEAILQIVKQNPDNRVLVCTDSNMAADHVATMLVKYAHFFSQEELLLRASSKYRTWETLPEILKNYSNGTNQANFEPISLQEFMSYNIVITTLSHAAKFGRKQQLPITHLFIDEAAQASEPSSLIPITGLLAASGQLVLAGDPHQLGPVVISRKASGYGLGTSLMERLMQSESFPMYNVTSGDPKYIVMLRNNFRSDQEILDIPDKLFYHGQLRALAAKDDLSDVDILGEKPHSKATVFHSILSKEQRVGKSPSYFNDMECDLVKQYVVALVTKHKVSVEEIGIVTPYIRQVYKIKKMLAELNYSRLEVGTVEAFQGKEKRVIIISTVRANCNLLDYDAKFQLGFLVDDKRFNVAITRAKAKVIIIGNPLCLERDEKWRIFIDKCRKLDTYLGVDSEKIQYYETSREISTKLKPMLDAIKLEDEQPVKRI